MIDIRIAVVTAAVVMATTACGGGDDDGASSSAADPAPSTTAGAAPAVTDGELVCTDASGVAAVIATKFAFDGARLVGAEAIEVPPEVSPNHRYMVLAIAQPEAWDPADPWGPADTEWPEYDPQDPRTMLPFDGLWLVDRLDSDPSAGILALSNGAQDLTTWEPASADLADAVLAWEASVRTQPVDCLSDLMWP